MKHLHLTRVLAFALALVLLLGCTACGKKTADDTGDTVGQKDTQTTVELDGKFTLNYSASAGMNPYKTQNSDNLAVCGLVYETLTELTDAFEAEPGLFTEWSSDDGETWTFTVNTDRTFHDGHQLNAQDAAYTIQTAAASPLYSGRLSAVKDVTDNDDGTVTVTLARANTRFPRCSTSQSSKTTRPTAPTPAARGCTRSRPITRASRSIPATRTRTRHQSTQSTSWSASRSRRSSLRLMTASSTLRSATPAPART